MKLPRWLQEKVVKMHWSFPVPVAYHCGSIHYLYKGDELFRADGKWISLGCEGSFKTLKEADKFWDDYFKDCQRIA